MSIDYDEADEVFFNGRLYSTEIEDGDDGSGKPHQVFYLKDQQVWVEDSAAQPGDTVLVTEGLEDGEDWAPNVAWHSYMDKYVGQALKISSIEDDGIKLDCDDGEVFLFPFHCLSKVDLSTDPRMFMPVLAKRENGMWGKDYYVTRLPNGKHLLTSLGEVAEVVPLPLREATKSMKDLMDTVLDLADQYWSVCPEKFKYLITPKLVKSLRQTNKDLMAEHSRLLSLAMEK